MEILYHMVFYCHIHVERSKTTGHPHHGFLLVGFFPEACHSFGRPQTSSLNIYVCVGISSIGWFNDELTLSTWFLTGRHTCRSRKQYDHIQNIHNPHHGFLIVGFFPNAFYCFKGPQTSSLNMVYVCVGVSFIGWWNDWVTLPIPMIFHCQTCMQKAVWPDHPLSPPWVLACRILS